MHSYIKQSDRFCIEFLLSKQYAYAKIGKELGYHRITIQREIGRNSVDGMYKARFAQKKSKERKMQSKIKYSIIDNDISCQKFILKYLKIVLVSRTN